MACSRFSVTPAACGLPCRVQHQSGKNRDASPPPGEQRGRIQGAPPELAMDQAVCAYVASYLAGRDVLLMAADWARCRELSARIRGAGSASSTGPTTRRCSSSGCIKTCSPRSDCRSFYPSEYPGAEVD